MDEFDSNGTYPGSLDDSSRMAPWRLNSSTSGLAKSLFMNLPWFVDNVDFWVKPLGNAAAAALT